MKYKVGLNGRCKNCGALESNHDRKENCPEFAKRRVGE